MTQWIRKYVELSIYNLTTLDYFLWSYVKAHVYTDKSTSIDTLEDNFEVFIYEIQAEMLERIGLSG